MSPQHRRPTRRAALAGAAALALPALGRTAAQDGAPNPQPFRFEDVARRAREIAGVPYEPGPPLPEALARLEAGAYRDIRFRPERALLGADGGPFRMQLFHLGPPHPRPATVNVVRDGIPVPVAYQAGLFETGRAPLERLPVNLGFAGLRLHAPLNAPRALDELVVFLGPAEFRVLGRDQRYGLAARALLADGADEAAPHFREYWVDLPKADADGAVVHALLDGPAATGAFRFAIRPGEDTAVDVRAALYPLRPLADVGLAPLLSSFLAGEGGRRAGGYRPEIHDTDGLLMHSGGGEWLWRPHRNPRERAVSSFGDRNPRGFGLLQRDRAFESYQDLAAGFERRPGYWVEPQGEWGEGRVVVIEEPSDDPFARNVRAAWQPREPLMPGSEASYRYRLRTVGSPEALHPGGRCVNTFSEPGEGARPEAPARRFLVDFSGGDLAYHLADPASVEAVASAGGATVTGVSVVPNPHIGGFRALIDARLDAPGGTADLRAFLRAGPRALTETWTLPWPG